MIFLDVKKAFSRILTLAFICAVLLLFLPFVAGRVEAQVIDKNALQSQIDAKNGELNQIQQQLQEQQKKLLETQSQKSTLSSEVSRINANISQINLNIKASQISIDRLNLQVQVLQGQMSAAQDDIDIKQQAVDSLLRQMQQAEDENVIIAFLKNRTLSEGIMEAQSLQDLNNNFILKIKELNDAKTHLNNVLAETSSTKNQKQVEYVNYQSKKEIANELKQEKQQFLDETKNKEKVYQDSIKQLQQRQLDIALEIQKIEAQLRSKIDYKRLPKSIPGLLATPINAPITQGYGATKFALRSGREPGNWHNGIDFGAPIGTPVFAADDGVVVATDNQDKYCYRGAYGKYAAIKHYNGLTTIYGHLSLYIVREGDQVKRGQVIGYSGNTGNSTGPHLHFTVYDSGTFSIDGTKSCGPKMPHGGDLNPLNYVSV